MSILPNGLSYDSDIGIAIYNPTLPSGESILAIEFSNTTNPQDIASAKSAKDAVLSHLPVELQANQVLAGTRVRDDTDTSNATNIFGPNPQLTIPLPPGLTSEVAIPAAMEAVRNAVHRIRAQLSDPNADVQPDSVVLGGQSAGAATGV